MAHGVLAAIRREWNDLPAAVELAGRAWELGRRGGSPTACWAASPCACSPPAATSPAPSPPSTAPRSDAPRRPAALGGDHPRLARRHPARPRPGRRRRASRWRPPPAGRGSGAARRLAGRREVPGHPPPRVPALVAVRILVARGETDRALDLLPSSSRGGAERTRPLDLEILVPGGAGLEARGEAEAALAALRRGPGPGRAGRVRAHLRGRGAGARRADPPGGAGHRLRRLRPPARRGAFGPAGTAPEPRPAPVAAVQAAGAALRARGRGAAADRHRPLQRRRRPQALHRAEHGQEAPGEHLRQARHPQPDPGDRPGPGGGLL